MNGTDGKLRCRTAALDAGTISTDREDHLTRQKGVEPQAAAAPHALAGLGLRLVPASNAAAPETRWPAAQAAGAHELSSVGLISYSLNTGKDKPLFYDLVITAAQCPPGKIVFAGDRIDYAVAAPKRARMQACLVRPGGLRPGEHLPGGALMIAHVAELPALLEAT